MILILYLFILTKLFIGILVTICVILNLLNVVKTKYDPVSLRIIDVIHLLEYFH